MEVGKREEKRLEGKNLLSLGKSIHSRDSWVFTSCERRTSSSLLKVAWTRYSMQLGCLICVVFDVRMSACAGSIPETISASLFPSVDTNSPVSLQSSLLSNMLLQACFVCKEYISTEGKPVWWGWECSPLRKRIRWERRQSRLISQSDSYFVSFFITVSPENWNWDPKEQLGSEEKKQVGSLMLRFVDYGY